MSLKVDKQEFSIVVRGSMNPAIHHPSWYRATELCDANDETLALQDLQNFVCLPAVAQFETPSFGIRCDLQTWTISTTLQSELDRILDVSIGVFEHKLPETPIRAFGFNFQYHRETQKEDINSYFSVCFASLPIGKVYRPESAQFITSQKMAGNKQIKKTLNTRIEPSPLGLNTVFVAMNFHYDIFISEKPTHFRIEPMLKAGFSDDREYAPERIDDIVEAINNQ